MIDTLSFRSQLERTCPDRQDNGLGEDIGGSDGGEEGAELCSVIQLTESQFQETHDNEIGNNNTKNSILCSRTIKDKQITKDSALFLFIG